MGALHVVTPEEHGGGQSPLAGLLTRATLAWAQPVALPLAESLYGKGKDLTQPEALQSVLELAGCRTAVLQPQDIATATMPVLAWSKQVLGPCLRMPDGTWFGPDNTPCKQPHTPFETMLGLLPSLSTTDEAEEAGAIVPLLGLSTAGMGWFWKPFQGAGGLMVQLALWGVAIQVASACIPLFSMAVYDRVVPLSALQTLWLLGLGIGLMMALDVCLRVLKSYGLGQLVAKAAHAQDSALLGKLFRQRGATDLARQMDVLRTTQDVREQLIMHILPHMAELPSVFLFLGLVAWVAPVLLAIPVGLIVFNVLLQFAMVPMLTKAARQWSLAGNRRTMLLFELLHGNQHRRLANRQHDGVQHWLATSGALHVAEGKGLIWQTLGAQITIALAQISYVLVVVVGAFEVVRGQLTVGALVAASMLCSRALTPALQLTETMGRLHKVRLGLKQIEKALAHPQDVLVPTANTPETLMNPQGALTLKQVAFAPAESGKEIIRNITLGMSAGSRWAVVGSNGAGKSTLLNVISGLWVPTAGSVLLDGVDTARMPVAELRRSVAYVPQAPSFPNVSVQEILAGLAPVDETAMRQALDVSGFGAVLAEKGAGIGLRPGPDASLLSGGQRQLLALAAALYRRPKLLLLDEPTSMLDTDAEQALCQRLDAWLKATGTGLVLVTHRLSLLSLTSHMAVLAGGNLLMAGPQKDVMARLKEGPRAA
jgi:ATP-binding cassette subfamily C protein LapB